MNLHPFRDKIMKYSRSWRHIMKLTADLNMVKKINKSLVLEQIRQRAPISRALIAERTGLTKATVSSLVQELIDSHLVHEIGAGKSRGGRRPMMLHFNSNAGHAIGIDLGVKSFTAVLVDLNGAVIAEEYSRHRSSSETEVIRDVKEAIRKLCRQAPESPYGIIGIGIGIPGFSDEEGNVLFAPNLGWNDVPLRQTLEQEFSIPVIIENEANAGAVGERQFGSGRGTSSLIYVSLSEGIGTGIWINDELYRGVSGFAGEFGHVSVDPYGKPCRCGNSGCWELYASENALLESARIAFADETIDLHDLLKRADEGDPTALSLFDRVGRYLGIGIVNMMNAFNPEKIVLGGRLALARRWLEGAIFEELEKRSVPHPRKKLQLMFTGASGRATVLGAAWMAISDFIGAEPKQVKGEI